MTLCPCGSKRPLYKCCAQIHQDDQLATTAQQLMRARYSAFVLNDIDFIIQTYHSSCKAQEQRPQILDAMQLQWFKLEVITVTDDNVDSKEAFVEFKASYMQNAKRQILHERSRFIKETVHQQNCWRYLDGNYTGNRYGTEQTAKIRRNDPCPCNSGKKFKKCCF